MKGALQYAGFKTTQPLPHPYSTAHFTKNSATKNKELINPMLVLQICLDLDEAKNLLKQIKDDSLDPTLVINQQAI